MNGYIGYIRVSTTRQGEGVSLPVQKEGISRYGERHQHPIGLWLEETETAAKQGRPVFNQAIKLLHQGKYRGIILHKLDRGVRNLEDWLGLIRLSDKGVEVHFVNESLDLQSRGGRLSADIQAVVSADYIRNLREETRKGFYGRLKQGLYPLAAPLGYSNNGKGKEKTIDPVKGPLVRKAFELYATARYNFAALGEELHALGLRNHNGKRVTRNGISKLLNNPFYVGIITIKKTNETFIGIHKPLIRKCLFDRVHDVLTGKTNVRTQRHDFLFRRLLTCAQCNYSLIGERQKGHVYYRCHTKKCSGTSIRENLVTERFLELLQCLQFNDVERAYFKARVLKMREDWSDQKDEEKVSLALRLDQIKSRLNRLTDAYIDKDLDKVMFEERKKVLLLDQKQVEENLANLSTKKPAGPERLEKFLELAENALLSHELATVEEKRQMVEILTSNRRVSGKNLAIEPSMPFREIVNRFKSSPCSLQRDIPRTWDPILHTLSKLNKDGLIPDLCTTAFDCSRSDTDKISLN
jgi:site-specific DNA recombinase